MQLKKNTLHLKAPIMVLLMLLMSATTVFAMHIAESYLPLPWALFWTAIMIPVVVIALKNTQKILKVDPNRIYLFGVMVAFAFTLSSLKMPSVMGSSSHPTGVGLGAILLGPSPMVLIGLIVLIFQTLLLAHGGITTLGANCFTMGFVGPLVSWGLYKGLGRLGVSRNVSVFIAATLGNWATYIATSSQLALAFPDASSGYMGSFIKFLGVFAITQVPIAIVEGLLTLLVFNYIVSIRPTADPLTCNLNQ